MPITYIEAITEGLRDEMRRDESVFVIGEDVGAYGGAFKVTKGLMEEFGESRVIDTPIAEVGIIGAAMGAAIAGMRPVAEMQFSDFVTNAFNQIVSNVAKFHYRTYIPLPMVIRLPSGGGVRGGPYHSTNPEAWFFHVPGLKLVAPSNPYDAKGLLKAAIRDPNPVLYFEHKFLYRHVKAEIPPDDFVVMIGKADIKREGSDISVITYGTGVLWATQAAETLSKEDGVEVEVLDLRTLLPLDTEAILSTVRKTGKVLILHEDTLTGGIGGEIAAIIGDKAFQSLDAPIKRLASLDTPVPFAPPLEDFFLPNTEKTVKALRELATF